MTKSIIVVHGVGAPEPGAEIEKLADAVNDAGTSMQKSTIRSHGQDIPVGEMTHNGEEIRLYEMNWSHTVEPATTARHVIGQVFRLVFAAAQISQSGWRAIESETGNFVSMPSFIGKLYRWTLVTVTIWAPVLAVTVILAEILHEHYEYYAKFIAIAVGLLVGLAGFFLRDIDKLAGRFAYLWAVLIVFFGVMVANGTWCRADLSNWVTKPSVFVGIYGLGFLLIFGVVESFWRGKGASSTVRSSSFRASMFVIPFIVFAAAWGPVVFTAQFLVADQFVSGSVTGNGIDYSEVKAIYDEVAKGLPYDLVALEIVNFLAFVFAILSLVFFLLIWYGLLGTDFAKTRGWGDQFRRLVGSWLLILIAVGAVTVVPIIVQTFNGIPSESSLPKSGIFHSAFSLFFPVDDSSVLEVYRASMWRIAAVLLFLIPKVGRIVAIFSQIVFYIAPKWSPLSSSDGLKKQFNDIVDLANQKGGEPPIILAYSQGSKIVVDSLESGAVTAKGLVTIGSPVGTIHESFLSMPIPTHDLSWQNFFRPSDFVGGSINKKDVNNIQIDENFTSTHFEYYREKMVLTALGLD